MSLFFKSIFTVGILAILALADDKDQKYQDLIPAQDVNLTVVYSENELLVVGGCPQPEAAEHAPGCPQLTWDNDDFLTATFNTPTATSGPPPSVVYVMRCFSDESIKQRAWRKHKDVISKDKQCKKVGEVDVAGAAPLEYKYVIPSDTPEATYYVRLLVRCGEGDEQVYCQDDNSLSVNGYYSVKPMDSIPAGLVVGVVIAVIIAPSFLVLYFIYEFVILKK